MREPKFPGFTGEAALYETKSQYQGMASGKPGVAGVTPAGIGGWCLRGGVPVWCYCGCNYDLTCPAGC
jgi:hypothetical protein